MKIIDLRLLSRRFRDDLVDRGTLLGGPRTDYAQRLRDIADLLDRLAPLQEGLAKRLEQVEASVRSFGDGGAPSPEHLMRERTLLRGIMKAIRG